MRLALVSILFLAVAGCSASAPNPVTYTELAMGTVVEISLWQDGDIVNLGFDEIKRIEDKFSRFKETSEISKLNRDPLADVSAECGFLIEESQKYFKITDGAFNVKYEDGRKYDLGGIAKGYAADRVAKILKQNGVKNAKINMGGNLYLLGYPPKKNFWVIGIRDPKKTDKLIGSIKLSTGVGVSTSGNYERPGHIINPKTGRSVDELLSVTIIAPTALEADALSTGVFVLGKEKGSALIEKLPEVEGVIIDKDGVWVSSGLMDRYENLH